MTIQELGSIGEFVSSIVILITLIYLSLQIRQNTNAIHSQSRADIYRGAQEELWRNIEYPDITINLIDPDREMSIEEKVRLDAWLAASMRAREFAWLQYQNGSIDELQWKSECEVVRVILGSKRSRAWWKSLGRLGFSEEFVLFVEELIANEPESEYFAGILNLK